METATNTTIILVAPPQNTIPATTAITVKIDVKTRINLNCERIRIENI